MIDATLKRGLASSGGTSLASLRRISFIWVCLLVFIGCVDSDTFLQIPEPIAYNPQADFTFEPGDAMTHPDGGVWVNWSLFRFWVNKPRIVALVPLVDSRPAADPVYTWSGGNEGIGHDSIILSISSFRDDSDRCDPQEGPCIEWGY